MIILCHLWKEVFCFLMDIIKLFVCYLFEFLALVSAFGDCVGFLDMLVLAGVQTVTSHCLYFPTKSAMNMTFDSS